MAKNKKTCDEVEIFMDIFKDIPENKRSLASGLIHNAAFMRKLLQRLQDDLDNCDLVETWNNGGGQSGQKISTTLQAYNKTVASYNQIIKTLLGLLPSEQAAAAKDDLMNFLK